MAARTRSTAKLALRHPLILPVLTVLAVTSTSCGQSVNYSHEVSDCTPISDQSDEFEPLVLPDGHQFLCGTLTPDTCIQLGEQQFASLTVEADRININYLGDPDRLERTCSEDIGIVMLVVSTDEASVSSSLPVYFEGSKVVAVE